MDILKTKTHLTARELVNELVDRTMSAIKTKRSEMKLMLGNRGHVSWSSEDKQLLMDNQQMSAEALSELLGKPVSSIYHFRSKLKAKREFNCVVCGIPTRNLEKYCEKHRSVSNRYKQYKSRCLKFSRHFEMSISEFSKMVDKPCVYCGDDATGIDRVDSSKGYHADNIVPCCFTCNMMKSNTPADTWISHMNKIIQHMESK